MMALAHLNKINHRELKRNCKLENTCCSVADPTLNVAGEFEPLCSLLHVHILQGRNVVSFCPFQGCFAHGRDYMHL